MTYELKQLKKDYSELEKKYKLASFKEMNEAFELEKIDYESEILLKVIRKVIVERIHNLMNFMDMLLNPVNAPRMYFPYIKSMSVDDKKLLEKLHDRFASLSLAALQNEVEYNEKDEAESVKNMFKGWNESRNDIGKILAHIQNPEKVDPSSKSKSYFG